MNPRRIPRTQADVDKAMDEGRKFGVEFAINVVLYVLKDKHAGTDEEIMQLRDEFMDVVDSVARKYLSYADIKRCLKSEYDLTAEVK